MRANDLKTGMAVKINDKIYVAVKINFTKPGKGPAYVQAKLKAIKGSGYIEKRFGSTETIEGVGVDRRVMEFLYAEQDGFVFMDSENYDQTTLDKELLGDSAEYLTPNLRITVAFAEGSPVMMELPGSVEMEVTDTPPGIKGATATNQLKEATLETGLKTKVPPFITPGDRVKISTADGSYMARA